ncbi:TrmH family RNA methyltransferase [Ekhidna sp.]|uniref:TrmH family RNA methyltransferase n=1 Tax=Ekhidna sp. TaxID=2608089 RepID=UPI003B507D51
MDHQRAIDILEEFVSENKQAHVGRVLSQRTRHVTLVFEDIDKSHNVSAVLRTAECMGIQDLHFIQNKNSYNVNPGITQGAAKWVSMLHHNKYGNNIDACYDELRNNGYKIFATSLNHTSRSIHELNPSDKTAFVFGTESDGISEEAGEKADGFVHIPMQGFTESFNLSVSAAICLTIFKLKLKEWPPLTDQEKLVLRSEWYRKIVREADLILKTKGLTV